MAIATFSFWGPMGKEDGDFLLASNIPFSTAKSILGGNEIIEVVVGLAPVGAFAVNKLISIAVEQMRSKKFISLKVDGIEIRGVSENTVKEILSRHISSGSGARGESHGED